MTKTAQDLAEERRAHLAGRKAEGAKDWAKARAEYAKALDARLAARAADPGYTDPAWGGDLKAIRTRRDFNHDLNQRLRLPKGEQEPQALDAPAVNVTGNLQQVDADLERYYRQKLGENLNPVFQVDLKDAASVVVVPDQWRVVKEGVTQCEVCHHPKAQHQPNFGPCVARMFASDQPGEIVACECAGYVPEVCRHAFENLSASMRRCVGCGEQQQLFPKMQPEDTLAFQQLKKEARARQ